MEVLALVLLNGFQFWVRKIEVMTNSLTGGVVGHWVECLQDPGLAFGEPVEAGHRFALPSGSEMALPPMGASAWLALSFALRSDSIFRGPVSGHGFVTANGVLKAYGELSRYLVPIGRPCLPVDLGLFASGPAPDVRLVCNNGSLSGRPMPLAFGPPAPLRCECGRTLSAGYLCDTCDIGGEDYTDDPACEYWRD